MHWCLGFHGSGSTWVFNAVRKVALAQAPGRTLREVYVVSHADLGRADLGRAGLGHADVGHAGLVGLDDPAVAENAPLLIVKSHATDEAAAAELSQHARVIWLSIRDPRDCVASLMQYHAVAFDAALSHVESDVRFCGRFTTHPRARVLRYEAGFIDAPATLDHIAAGFGGVLDPDDRARIFAETRRPAIEAFIAQLDQLPTAVRPSPGNLVDTVTQWHNHHANRTGEVGRWRHSLTQPQAAAVELRLGNCMNSLGYATELVFG
jgi:hypothetical protein